MLCEQCKVNQAEIHLVNVVNGERHVQHLCRECAITSLHLDDAANLMKMSFSVEGLTKIEDALKDLLFPSAAKHAPRTARRHVCPHCGGILPESMFADGGAEESRDDEDAPDAMSADDELSALETKMADAVRREDYEFAAKLRDRIAEVKNAGAERKSEAE